MKNALGAAGKTPALRTSLAILLAVLVSSSAAPSAGAAVPGGVASTSADVGETGPPGRAMLVDGRAIPPLDAPPAVKRVIAAANKIRSKPYVWGGGHARWWDRGYDCSGAVSFALHGAGLLPSPLPSGSLARWGRPGRGRWISVYANGGHVYAVIAGLRWDTAGNVRGTGPRWHKSPRAAASGPYVARHPAGY